MNAMVYTHLPEVIGLTILHSLWQVTLLWVLLVAVLRLWPQASSALRYVLALGTLVLCLVFAGATALYEWETLKPVQQTWQIDTGFTEVPNITGGLKQTTAWTALLQTVDSAAPWLAWLWLAGLAFMAVRFTGSLYYLKSLRRPATLTSMDEAWQQRFEALVRAVGLKRKVILAVSARITSPLTMGNLSPIVLLPAGLITGLSTTQLESILVHELYHIKRRDYLVNILQAWVEVLMFYHPALWHISRIVRDERENCCDDLTLALCGDPVPYARALTQIHETNSLTKPTLAMSVSGPAGSFAIRIKRLFNIYPNPARARSKGLFAIGLLLTCMGLLLMSANALPVSSANTVHSAIRPVVFPATVKADTVLPDTSKLNNIVVDGYRTVPDKKADSYREEVQELQNDKTIYYVDGKRVSKAEADAIEPSRITSINVWKGEKAVLRYGEEARGGVVEMITDAHAARNEAGEKDIYVVEKPGKDFYIIDDKMASKAEAAKLDLARVETVDVWKAEKPVAKYNIDSKDVVVDVITKKQLAAGETPAKVYVVDKPAKTIKGDAVHVKAAKQLKYESGAEKYGKDAEKYGTEAKEGAAQIQAKQQMAVITEDAAPAESIKLTADKISISYAKTGQLQAQPLYIVNGVETSSEALQQLDPSNIQVINVYKNESAIDAYGPKGANGVINIQLKPGVEYKPVQLEAIQPLKLLPVENNADTEMQVYPNAASTTATVRFSVTKPRKGAPVTISVVNSEGSIQLVSGTYAMGTHEAVIDVSKLKKGIYFVQVTIGKTRQQQRLVVE